MASYIVLIEWDGDKAPSRWYRRLHKLALRSRGGEHKVDPMERRQALGSEAVEAHNATVRRHGRGRKARRISLTADMRGVIFQEGAIICPSQSLAETLAHLAEREGARAVKVGEVGWFGADGKAAAGAVRVDVLAKIDAVFGKKGRPEDAQNWVISCYEDLGTHTAQAVGVVNCPNCGGVNIRVREGSMHKYSDPQGDIVEAWARLRFVEGRFEINADGKTTPPALSVVEELITDHKELSVLNLVRQSPVLETVRKMAQADRAGAMRVLDAMFVARAYAAGKLADSRTEAAVAAFKMGVNPVAVRLDVPDLPDLLDTAAVLGAHYAAGLLVRAK